MSSKKISVREARGSKHLQWSISLTILEGSGVMRRELAHWIQLLRGHCHIYSECHRGYIVERMRREN